MDWCGRAEKPGGRKDVWKEEWWVTCIGSGSEKMKAKIKLSICRNWTGVAVPRAKTIRRQRGPRQREHKQ
jgi:hypothetical protein